MNSTTTIVGGIAAVAIIGGLVYFLTRDTDFFSPTATSTPTGSVDMGSSGSGSGSDTGSEEVPVVNGAGPGATTGNPTNITTKTATLRGAVNPNGKAATYWFEYSVDPSFAAAYLNTTGQKSAGSDKTPVAAQMTAASLMPNTTYYYRIVAQNSAGVVRGKSVTFKTK